MNQKLVKGFVVGLVGLMLMITLISLLIPSKVIVSRAVVVHAPAEKISAFITDLNQWKKWHPIFVQDSNKVTISIQGNKKVISWQQNGKENDLKFTQLLSGQVKFATESAGRKQSDNIISVLPLADGTGQQVEWTSVNYLKWYPWQKFGGMFLNQISGPGYELALNNLRDLVEGRSSQAN